MPEALGRPGAGSGRSAPFSRRVLAQANLQADVEGFWWARMVRVTTTAQLAERGGCTPPSPVGGSQWLLSLSDSKPALRLLSTSSSATADVLISLLLLLSGAPLLVVAALLTSSGMGGPIFIAVPQRLSSGQLNGIKHCAR